MTKINLSTYMKSKAWWVVLILGILFIIGGFAYWVWPVAGFAVASMLFGWLLIAAGLVQVCVSSGPDRPGGWGWWLAGGVIDMLIGFMLVRSIVLAESMFPFFMSFLFIYWGVESFFSAASGRKYWWLSVINGILLCIIGYFFLEGGFANTIFMSSFLVAIAFIYWGFTMCMAGYDMKPDKADR